MRCWQFSGCESRYLTRSDLHIWWHQTLWYIISRWMPVRCPTFSGCESHYLTGLSLRMWWYQPLWYFIDMLMPVRYSSTTLHAHSTPLQNAGSSATFSGVDWSPAQIVNDQDGQLMRTIAKVQIRCALPFRGKITRPAANDDLNVSGNWWFQGSVSIDDWLKRSEQSDEEVVLEGWFGRNNNQSILFSIIYLNVYERTCAQSRPVWRRKSFRIHASS